MIRMEDRPRDEAEWQKAGEMVLRLASRAFCVPMDRLMARSRSEQRVAYARQVAMYLLHVTFGGTYQEAGRALGRERTTVAYACSLVEDDRDDSVFDAKLGCLEDCLERLWYVERLRKVRAPMVQGASLAAA